MLSPASLRASSHLGTDIVPQLQLGWGTPCAAPSRRCLLGLGVCPWHLCSSGSGDPALPGAGSRGMVAAGCSRWLVVALCPATPGTAACNSPGSDCPVCKSTAHAHLGEQTENSTAQAGSCLVLRDPVGLLSLATDLTRGLQAPSRASRAVASHRRTRDTQSAIGGQLLPCGFAGPSPPRGGCWGHAPGTEHTAPSVPTHPKDPPSAIPKPVLLCWSGRYLTAGGL